MELLKQQNMKFKKEGPVDMKPKNVFATLLSIIMLCGCRGTEKAVRMSSRECFASSIVPQPKIVNAAKNAKLLELSPEDIKIVYGSNSPKCRIGADEINKQLFKMGFGDRNIPIVSDMEYQKGKEKALIVIGAQDENILAKSLRGNLTEKDAIKSMPDKPQGYIIDYVERNNDVPMLFIAGSSPQGTLYGAITLMQLFGKNGDKLLVPPVFVKDWPDFNWRYIAHMTHVFGQASRASAYTGEPYSGDMETGKEYIDWALRYKINIIGIKFWLADKELLPLLEYAKERGIYSFTSYPRPSIAVCDVKEKGENPEKYKGLNNLYRDKCYLSWSRDDLLAPLYVKFAENCKKYGIKFVWFHTADTGLTSLNYAQWNYRDALDKERFGNDYGKADAHVINMLYEIFQKYSPETRITYVTYPYTASVLADDFPQNIIPDISGAYAEEARKFIDNYFMTFAKDTPKDIYTCLRETERKNVELWVKATKHPILLYYETCRGGYNLLSSRPRYIKTFYFKDYDNIYFYPSIHESFIHGVEVPVEILLNAEYCWNVDQKGAAYFEKYDFSKDLSTPKVVFDEIVPRCTRAYWGAEAGKYFTPFFQAGIVPGFVENPFEFQRSLRKSFVKVLEISGNLTFANGSDIFFEGAVEEMEKQRSNIEKALPFLDEWMAEYKAKKADGFSYKYGVMLWLLSHYWHCKAAIWIPVLELRNHIDYGRKVEAEKALAAMKEQLAKAKLEISGALQIIIDEKHLCLMPKVNNLQLNEYMLNELEKFEAKYKELESGVKQINQSLVIDKSNLDSLKSRYLLAGKNLREAEMYTDFTVYATNPVKKAFYQSKARFFYDSKNLYVNVEMLDAKDQKPTSGRNETDKADFWEKGKEENDFEIYLAPSHSQFIYQLACDPLGRKFNIRILEKHFKKDSPWKCDWKVKTSIEKGYWTALLTIPFSSLGVKMPDAGDKWKICAMRQYVGKSGDHIFSVLRPGSEPNKPQTYIPLLFK